MLGAAGAQVGEGSLWSTSHSPQAPPSTPPHSWEMTLKTEAIRVDVSHCHAGPTLCPPRTDPCPQRKAPLRVWGTHPCWPQGHGSTGLPCISVLHTWHLSQLATPSSSGHLRFWEHCALLTPEGHPPPPWPSSCPHPHMLDVPGCHSYLPVSCFQCLLSPMTPRCLSLARASPSASGCHGHPEVADRQHHRCPHPAPPQASRGSAQPGRHSRLFWRSHTCRSWSESQ